MAAAACTSTSASSTGGATSSSRPSASSHGAPSPSKPANYDWLRVSSVQSALAQDIGVHVAAQRLRVLGEFHVNGQDVYVLSLDHGRMPGLTMALERKFYAISTVQARRHLAAQVGPGGQTVYRLGYLPFRLEPSRFTLHYVLILGKDDDYMLDQAPSSADIGTGSASTADLDTYTLTLLEDQGREGNLQSGAVEACQATAYAQPTATTIRKLEAAQRAPHKAKDLKKLLTLYRDLGQEVECNGLGYTVAARVLHQSWSVFHAILPYIVAETTDRLLEMTWLLPHSLYRQAR